MLRRGEAGLVAWNPTMTQNPTNVMGKGSGAGVRGWRAGCPPHQEQNRCGLAGAVGRAIVGPAGRASAGDVDVAA